MSEDIKVVPITSLESLLKALTEAGIVDGGPQVAMETPASVTMKNAESQGLTDEARDMFGMLCDAASNGDLAILQCTENATGKIVPVLVITRASEVTGGVDMLPIGVLFEPAVDDPCLKYTPVGDSIETVETERGKAKREAEEAAAAKGA